MLGSDVPRCTAELMPFSPHCLSLYMLKEHNLHMLSVLPRWEPSCLACSEQEVDHHFRPDIPTRRTVKIFTQAITSRCGHPLRCEAPLLTHHNHM